MADVTSTIQLRLTPLSVPFGPKTFAIRPTEKVRIDLVGAATSATPPRSDNGVFPCASLDQHPAHIVSNGSYFTLKTSVLESNSIKVDGFLLHDHTHTIRNGEIIEFGRATFVKLDEAYDEDGDYECWPTYSFVPAISMKVHLIFPPHFDSRRVWTDPFAPPVSYTPPSSIKATTALSPTPSKRHPVLTPTRVLDHVPRVPAPSLSPPRKSTAPQLDSVPVSDAATPHGTDWAGVAQLIDELHTAVPVSRSTFPSRSPISPRSPLPLVDAAQRTFCYGDFVDSSTAAARHGQTGAHAGKEESVATLETFDPPPTTVVPPMPPLSTVPFHAPPTSVSTSVLACEPIGLLPDLPLNRDRTANTLLHSEETALRRVADAWACARRAVDDSGLGSAQVAVARMGAAWRRARGAVDDIALPLVPPADRLDSSSSSSQGVVGDRLDRGIGGIACTPGSVAANRNSTGDGPSSASFAPFSQYIRPTPDVHHSPPMLFHRPQLHSIFPIPAALTALSCCHFDLISHIPLPLPPIHHHAQLPAYYPNPYLHARPPIHFL